VVAARVEAAEAEVTVSDERLHAERGGERQPASVRILGPSGVGLRGDVAHQAQAPRLPALLCALGGKLQGPARGVSGLVDPSGEQTRLAEEDQDGGGGELAELSQAPREKRARVDALFGVDAPALQLRLESRHVATEQLDAATVVPDPVADLREIEVR